MVSELLDNDVCDNSTAAARYRIVILDPLWYDFFFLRHDLRHGSLSPGYEDSTPVRRESSWALFELSSDLVQVRTTSLSRCPVQIGLSPGSMTRCRARAVGMRFGPFFRDDAALCRNNEQSHPDEFSCMLPKLCRT